MNILINDKYFKAIEHIFETKNTFDWKEIPYEWIRNLELPDHESGDLRDCYYFKQDGNQLCIAVGSYLSRFYFDEDKYSTSTEYFISFFILRENNFIKGMNVVTVDDYWRYKSENDLIKISESLSKDSGVIKRLYEHAKNQVYNIDDLLSGFINDEPE